MLLVYRWNGMSRLIRGGMLMLNLRCLLMGLLVNDARRSREWQVLRSGLALRGMWVMLHGGHSH